MSDMEKLVKSDSCVNDIKTIIEQGRQASYSSVNLVMINTFWNVGRRIVEEEQNGAERAEYGDYLIKRIASELTKEYGSSFNYRNICFYRQFYLNFKDLEIVNTRVHNLTWSHFRTLLRVSDEDARIWYMKEANDQMWSVRTLDRNISTQYYHRLLRSPRKEDYEIFSSQDEAEKREKYFKSGSGREWLKEKIKEVIYDRCK